MDRFNKLSTSLIERSFHQHAILRFVSTPPTPQWKNKIEENPDLCAFLKECIVKLEALERDSVIMTEIACGPRKNEDYILDVFIWGKGYKAPLSKEFIKTQEPRSRVPDKFDIARSWFHNNSIAWEIRFNYASPNNDHRRSMSKASTPMMAPSYREPSIDPYANIELSKQNRSPSPPRKSRIRSESKSRSRSRSPTRYRSRSKTRSRSRSPEKKKRSSSKKRASSKSTKKGRFSLKSVFFPPRE